MILQHMKSTHYENFKRDSTWE